MTQTRNLGMHSSELTGCQAMSTVYAGRVLNRLFLQTHLKARSHSYACVLPFVSTETVESVEVHQQRALGLQMLTQHQT
jgi:hypothetical protein